MNKIKTDMKIRMWEFHSTCRRKVLVLICMLSGQVSTQPNPTTPGLINCGKTEFNVSYVNQPPFMFTKRGHGVTGAIAAPLQQAVEVCCGSNVRTTFVKKHDLLRHLEENVGAEDDVIAPVLRHSFAVTAGITGYVYVPVIETSGSVLIVREESEESNPVADSLQGCWPLAILVISSAGLAGIIVWILDRYLNPEEFPKSFTQGCWEGTWWAYVTMTTVGYGDRAPKSIPARAFGLVWMFVGIVMMSIFTATLASAFTSSTSSDDVNIRGSKVGVVRGSMELIIAYREGADVYPYNGFPDIFDALNNKTIDAALADINYALYSAETITENGLTVGDKITNLASYGVVLYNQSTEIEQCITLKLTQYQFKVFDSMIDDINKLKGREGSSASQTTSSIFDGMVTVIIVVTVLWVVTFICCLMWDLFYYRPKLNKAKSNKVTTSNGDTTSDNIASNATTNSAVNHGNEMSKMKLKESLNLPGYPDNSSI